MAKKHSTGTKSTAAKRVDRACDEEKRLLDLYRMLESRHEKRALFTLLASIVYGRLTGSTNRVPLKQLIEVSV